MIPEEDRGPAWLRDYGFTDFGNIAADINAMQEYAKKLAADVEQNLTPHLSGMSQEMMSLLPTSEGFYELDSFIQRHSDVSDLTRTNIYQFTNGTATLAAAADSVSEKYRGTDAFAHAKVSDISMILRPGDATSGTGEVLH